MDCQKEPNKTLPKTKDLINPRTPANRTSRAPIPKALHGRPPINASPVEIIPTLSPAPQEPVAVVRHLSPHGHSTRARDMGMRLRLRLRLSVCFF